MWPGLVTYKRLHPWDDRNAATSPLISVLPSVINKIVDIKLGEKTSSVLKWSNFASKFVNVTASPRLSMRTIGAHSVDNAIFLMHSL